MDIIQLTDLHLPPHAHETVQGQDTYQVFEALLPIIKAEHPDLLIISGDIAANVPEPQCYHYLKEQLESFPSPWLVLKGNHDRSPLFDEIFQHHSIQGFQHKPTPTTIPLLFFDTSPELPPQKALQDLEKYLSESLQPNYLFTHYPPIKVGNPFFDEKYPLLWQSEFFQVLSQSRQPFFVFFGHIHYEYQIQINQGHYYAAPSSTLPIVSGSSRFVLDKQKAYFRKIVLSSKTFKTSVHQVPLPN